MTRSEATRKVAEYWLQKAHAALQSAQPESAAGRRYEFSIIEPCING